ncbi:haloacid dehalogenase type II [Celeribacter halophilus]|uniref:(S)-2-haloacid dehalogenase n=1 Tax=Celeribacter halophilus TaxID=576117 RepID=A0AAW7XW77_9RHOB|nr:haloacid dehalogenase type II [Celeribacter halophilus]MDO6457254.1 haloacid dehalogenase type II [Celeribacter halophilus]MDO6722294.1 haloacid dehalogenase type II [Celeribacter halophilus]
MTPSHPARPSRSGILVFDVNETLLDLTSLSPLFERVFGDAQVLREWFPELILYSQTLTLTGLYRPFGEIAAAVFEMVAANHQAKVTPDDIAELKTRLTSMPAYPDVAPALTRLQDAGFRLVTLTNSAPNAALSSDPSPLEKAGIASFFDAHFTVHWGKRFKPHPDVYDSTAETLGAKPEELCMIACHIWDTIGAQARGWRGGFVARPHNAPLTLAEVPQPDFIGRDMGELADQLIAGLTA